MIRQTKTQLNISTNILNFLIKTYDIDFIKINKNFIIKFINFEFKKEKEKEIYNVCKLNSWIYNKVYKSKKTNKLEKSINKKKLVKSIKEEKNKKFFNDTLLKNELLKNDLLKNDLLIDELLVSKELINELPCDKELLNELYNQDEIELERRLLGELFN